jgi:hypothetical protein
VAQNYSTNNVFIWTPAQGGTYQIAVWVENQGAPSNSYDRDTVINRTAIGCTSVSFYSANSWLPVPVNTTQTFYASSVCNGTAVYKWWVWFEGTWKEASGYSSSPEFAWKPIKPGNYSVAVWVELFGGPAYSYDRDYFEARTAIGPQ